MGAKAAMVTALKTAIIEDLKASTFVLSLPVEIHFTDSEIEDQPTSASPLFQLRFVRDFSGIGVQGTGNPREFPTRIDLVAHFKTTNPGNNQATLFDTWYSENDQGDLQGLKIALNDIMARGLKVGTRQWAIQVGDTTPIRPYGSNTGILETTISCYFEY